MCSLIEAMIKHLMRTNYGQICACQLNRNSWQVITIMSLTLQIRQTVASSGSSYFTLIPLKPFVAAWVNCICRRVMMQHCKRPDSGSSSHCSAQGTALNQYIPCTTWQPWQRGASNDPLYFTSIVLKSIATAQTGCFDCIGANTLMMSIVA